MGRGRGKGKKLTVTNHEDTGSGEDEKIPMQKRRGRPQKPLKDGFDEDEVEKMEDDSDNVKNGVSSKEIKNPTATELGRKRKLNSQVKEKLESAEEENGVGNQSSTDELTKCNGFRHNGSRRKSKPRRAAEAESESKSPFTLLEESNFESEFACEMNTAHGVHVIIRSRLIGETLAIAAKAF